MTERSLQELVQDAINACRKPLSSDFDPSAVIVCPPHLIHLLEQRVISELQPELENGECLVISAERLMHDFWAEAASKGDPIHNHSPRIIRRFMDYEEQEFPKRILSSIKQAFESRPNLKTCLVTGLWVFYPSVHTSSILSDLKNSNTKGQIIFFYPGVDQDGISLKLLGIEDGFGYKARRI